jgi:hypothetical protein
VGKYFMGSHFHWNDESQGLPAVLDLASLMANQGTLIEGAVANDRAGVSVSNAGDVNGDGIPDLVVGAYLASPMNRTKAGAIYLIYGSKTSAAILDFNILSMTQGMMIEGAVAGDQAGHSAASVGDVNGDSITDLVFGAYLASPLGRAHAGAAYVIYGSRPLPAVLDLNTTLTQAQGMVIQGAVRGDQTGYSVASAGDVNGDNISDLVVGAWQHPP